MVQRATQTAAPEAQPHESKLSVESGGRYPSTLPTLSRNAVLLPWRASYTTAICDLLTPAIFLLSKNVLKSVV